jgi:D-beta-D-heptose 7-phosphate kinase / D-beta-D-heptose 1-phosphate adenosyltransferase
MTGVTLAPLVVVGDTLLDRDVAGTVSRLAPDAPVPVLDAETARARPGGAGLAALLAAGGGRDVTLVTALAADEAGEELRGLLAAAGVEVVDLGLDGPTPEKVRVRAGDRSLVRIDRGGRGGQGRVGAVTAHARAAIGWAAAVLVADYGRGMTWEPGIREVLGAIVGDAPVVWDPHPGGAEPVPGVALATPNAKEAARFAPDVEADGDRELLVARARALAARWRAGAVCITRGAAGALLVGDGIDEPREIPTTRSDGGDPCGAGDRFASRAAELLAEGASAAEAVAGSVAAATAFVAAGGAGAIEVRTGEPAATAAKLRREGRFTSARMRGDAKPATERPVVTADGLAEATGLDREIADVVARTRAAGGTVVATGGCFDLLHTGHVRTLEAARALGDCLIVLLNGDDSVRRLKGPERPVVAENDRAAVLRSLRCVDGVVVFEEDDPSAALDRLRPDVWAKGGDYAVEDLPEAEALARWGCRIVLLPYLEGRSTTKLIEEASLRAV